MPVPIELTITASREDLKHAAYFLARSHRSWSHLKAIVWAGGAFLAFFAEHWIVLGLCATVSLYDFLEPSWRLFWQLRQIPDWAYGPTSYSLDDSGVFAMAPQAGRQLSWAAINKVTLTDDAWIFNAAGQAPIVLHRRQLSKEDEAAIRAMAEFHDR